MIIGTILIIFAIIIGMIALAAIFTMGGAVVMVAIDLIIFGFAVYGFYKFMQWYRNR